jgi:hypothetical protein
MAGSRTLKLSILGDVDGLNKSLKSATKDVETFGDKMGKVGKIAGAALAAATVAAGAFAVKIGVEAVKAASDLSETISKVGVLFGKTSKDIEKFAEGAASSLGQTKQQALDAAATFATFGKAAGLSGRDLSKFSIDFVKLSSDLASFNNTSPEQAINAIGSALRGEAEPLRGVGAVALAAGVLSAANALASKGDTSTSALGASAAGFSGTMPNGQSFSTSGAVGSSGTKTVSPTVPTVVVPTLTPTATTSLAAASNAVAASSNGIPSNFDVGRFRMAENASMGTTINLTVTGAFDKEGTARTIVETLNNSYYRGTGGATNLVAI